MDYCIYNADVYCSACAADIKAQIRKEGGRVERDDSDSWPQPVDPNSDEADCPQHCGSHADCLNPMILSDGRKIGAFLENSLTTDGREYVKSTHRDKPSEITQFWVDHYDLADEIETELGQEFAESWIDGFLTSYLETAVWSSIDDKNQPLDDNYDSDDFAPEALSESRADCLAFLAENRSMLEPIADNETISRAGHDFWLTRNRHGAGFWDGDWSDEIGKALTESSRAYGSVEIMPADDGKLYV
jgi:hypothetical protein